MGDVTDCIDGIGRSFSTIQFEIVFSTQNILGPTCFFAHDVLEME